MKDETVYSVQRIVRNYRKELFVDAFDQSSCSKHFGRLILRLLDRTQDIDHVDLYLVAAMCFLGPQDEGIPPYGLRERLRSIYEEKKGKPGNDIADSLLQYATAFGCGRWRTPNVRGGGWNQIWSKAQECLTFTIFQFTRQVNHWLYRHVHGFPDRQDTRYSEMQPYCRSVTSEAKPPCSQIEENLSSCAGIT